MSSRHIASVAPAARDYWRLLAERAGWDVPAAAQLLGVSLRQLERHCKRDLDCTPTEWFHTERMATAVRLLADRKSVKEVAFQLGYTRPANFSRDFKRQFGRNPRAFAPHSLFGVALDSKIIAEDESDRMRKTR